jgi:methionyl-tRNA formyltransferase
MSAVRARVVFLGSPDFAVPSLRVLHREHTIAWVVTQPARPAGRGRRVEVTAVHAAATALGLPVFTY